MQKKIEKSLFYEEILPRKPLQSHTTSHFFVRKKLLDVHMIMHKCQKNSSIHIENSFYQSSYFEAQKRTLLAFAG